MGHHLEEEYKRFEYYLKNRDKHGMRWKFQEIINIATRAIESGYLGTLEDKNFNFIWKAWIEIEDEDNPLIFSVWERIKIFWKKLLEIEEEFPQKFINIGEEKLRDAIIKDELKAKEKIDIFREFKNIGEKKGKNEIAKECNEIYNELKNLQKK